MPTVKLQQTWASPRGVYLAGREVDVPAELAAELCSTGQAVPVRGVPVERAVAAPCERAAVEPPAREPPAAEDAAEAPRPPKTKPRKQ